jgi:hypothetical protein
MGKLGQLEVVSHIRAELFKQRINLPSRSVSMLGGEVWLVFEPRSRSVGVDQASGVWVKEYE